MFSKKISGADALDRLINHPFLKPIAIFLIIFGCKLWLIHSSGVSCPFWDEWDVEARTLFKPWIENKLTWNSFLFATHNEHRLLMTRVLGLALLKWNQIWDPKLQMISGSLIHSLTAVMVYLWFKKETAGKVLEMIWALLILAVFSPPVGWENALMGIQSQIYFLILFSLTAVWFFSQYEPLTIKWFAGILFAVAANCSLASGILSLLAAVSIIVVRIIITRSCIRRWTGSIIILLLLFVLGIALTPKMGGQFLPKASSLNLSVISFLRMLSGPHFGEAWPAFVIWLPFFVLLSHIIFRRNDPSKRNRLVLGIGFLILLQAGALAYGRGNSSAVNARYFDLLLPGIFINFISMIILMNTCSQKFRQWIVFYAAVWAWLICGGFWGLVRGQINHSIRPRQELGRIQQSNVKGYVATGDFSYLKEKPWAHIPYPNTGVQQFRELLDDRAIRGILSSSIRLPLHGQVIENREDGFAVNGFTSDIPLLSNESIYGSFGKEKEKQFGKIMIRYLNEEGSVWVRIPVAGYPSKEGQSLKVRTADGKERKLFFLSKNPGNRWSSAYARVSKKEFFIEAEDRSEKYWFAMGEVKREGRLVMFAEFLLKSWAEFVRMGLIFLFIPFFYSVIRDESNHQEFSRGI